MQNRPGYSLDSVDHALRTLLLLRDKGELRVTEVAEALGVAKSTAHRLLSMLKYHDLAVQDAQRVYRPGPELTGVRPASPWVNLRGVVERQLRALSQRSGETTHFMALEGNSTRFLAGVEGERAPAVGSRVGLLLPAHATSGGKVLLAEMPTVALHALYPRGLPLIRTAAIADLAVLRRELAAIRRRGYATNMNESSRGVNAVGCCIRDVSGRAIGAAAIAVPSTRSSSKRISELAWMLGDAVLQVEQSLVAAS
jgi:DNA-binding IclR family transcriptional regulator